MQYHQKSSLCSNFLPRMSQNCFPVTLFKLKFKWGPHITWFIFLLGFFLSLRVPFTLILHVIKLFKKQCHLSCSISHIRYFVNYINLLSFNLFLYPHISCQLAGGSIGWLDSGLFFLFFGETIHRWYIIAPYCITCEEILVMLILVSGLRFHKPDSSIVKFPIIYLIVLASTKNFVLHSLFQKGLQNGDS